MLNQALGDENRTISFNVLQESKLSSFLDPLSGDDAPFAGSNIVVQKIAVECSRLEALYDELQTRYGFHRPCLKLDTQGFDLKVAQGAGDYLQKFLLVLTEMNVKLLYTGSPTIVESLDWFRGVRFDPVGFYSVHPSVLLDPHEFNCYLLRRDLATVAQE